MMTALGGTTTGREQRVPEVDRRAVDRFPVNAGTSCPFASPVVEDFGPVKVLNVSMNGIGLRLARRVTPGMLLAVSLTNQDKGFAKTVLVRIVHAADEPGGCVAGGSFVTPLSYQEMTALVL